MSPREQAAVLRAWAGLLERPEELARRQALEAGAWALDLISSLVDALTRSTPEEVHSAAREFAVLAGRETLVLSTLAPGHDAARRDHTRRAIKYGLAELALHAVARAMEATPTEVAP